MKDGYYLLSYKVNGIKNLDKDIKLEFYKKTIDKDFDPKEYNVKAIYGENGTGKSAIMTSVKVLKNLMLNRYYLADQNNLIILKNLINKKREELKIEIEYLYQNVLNENDIAIYIYRYFVNVAYDVETNHFYIKNEKLDEKRINSKTYTNIYEVVNGDVANKYDKKLFNILNGENGIDTLKEQTFLSNFYYKNFKKYFSDDPENYSDSETRLLFALFESIIFASSIYVYLDENDKYDEYMKNTIMDEYFRNGNESKMMPRLDKKAISDSIINGENTIVTKKYFNEFKKDVDKIYEFIKIFKPELNKIEIKTIEDRNDYNCSLVFVYKDYKVDYVFESNGIKKLTKLYNALNSVDFGKIVFIDEFDSNIHDVYLCRLIEYIKEYAKGQLCFTTQSITVMDVLENRKKSLDFLSRDHEVTSWFKNSHYSASRKYKEGYIENSPFNIEPFDFLKAFGAAIDEE